MSATLQEDMSKSSSRIAVFPGSFDPITLGHEDIIRRALPLFDKLYVAIGNNTSKQYLLDFEQRRDTVHDIFAGEAAIEVIGYHELTVSLCRRLNAGFIVRGLRSGTDFDYERNIAMTNKKLDSGLETVFFISGHEFAGITSTIVREVFKFGGDISGLVPAAALARIQRAGGH